MDKVIAVDEIADLPKNSVNLRITDKFVTHS